MFAIPGSVIPINENADEIEMLKLSQVKINDQSN